MIDRRAIMQDAWDRYRKHKAPAFNREWFRAALLWAWKDAKDRVAVAEEKARIAATEKQIAAEVEAQRSAGTLHTLNTAEMRELAISVSPFRHSAQRIRAEYATAA